MRGWSTGLQAGMLGKRSETGAPGGALQAGIFQRRKGKGVPEGARSLAFTALFALSACATAQPAPRWSIVVHGGAGVIERANLTPETEAQYRAALSAALEAGASVLRMAALRSTRSKPSSCEMEDDPLFNAGRGAVFTAEGKNELDASIMDGRTRAAGAVAGVTRTRHPISLARAVMEHSPHVMLIGEGAEAFARSRNLEAGRPVLLLHRTPLAAAWRSLAAQQSADPAAARPAPHANEQRTVARRSPVRHGRRRRAGRAGRHRRRHLHWRHDGQTLGPRRRHARHRRGHLRAERRLRGFAPRARANTSSAWASRGASARAWSCDGKSAQAAADDVIQRELAVLAAATAASSSWTATAAQPGA